MEEEMLSNNTPRVSGRRFIRVAVKPPDTSGPIRWIVAATDAEGSRAPTEVCEESTVVCTRAEDLRQAQRTRSDVRESVRTRTGSCEDVTVLVELEILIDLDARAARRRYSALTTTWLSGNSLTYVGTPNGLAQLIADIHATAVADGVRLVPLESSMAIEKVVDESISWLSERGLVVLTPESVLIPESVLSRN
ncbi:hypothetical protein I1A62_03480 (plasmid) [Rhodococcus sp. USK10]|uniref:hypothetical protein n=1 Tax=Rhodococcus sp. USK10 TaxID=2789739 RepID=UPI001C5E3413|nr:hypothetical protein [Rhodococcus sp. USK10]QYB00161.1 hypothetical protein I1A62_03480 [Rhodococcus sp. USK10]